MSKIILLRFWQVKKNCTTERAPLIFFNHFFLKIKVENKKKCCCEKSHNTNWAIPCIADTELILEYTPALKKNKCNKKQWGIVFTTDGGKGPNTLTMYREPTQVMYRYDGWKGFPMSCLPFWFSQHFLCLMSFWPWGKQPWYDGTYK